MIGVLSWLNENGLSSYPLAYSAIGVQDLIVDAHFQQFDNFVPTLKTIVVAQDRIEFVMDFDKETDKTVTLLQLGFSAPQAVVIHGADGRYYGKLVIGSGANILWANFLNQTLNVSVPFVSTVVRSIPSTAGVYSIQGANGEVELLHDTNIFYGVAGQNVVMNAVSLPSAITGTVLKTINGVAPTNNNLYIEDSDVFKIDNTAFGVLTFHTMVTSLYDVSSLVPET